MHLTDHQRAERLRKLHSQGVSWRRYFLKSPRLWLLALMTIGFLAYALTSPLERFTDRTIWLISGIFMGRVLRDLVWLKDAADSLPFMSKIIDWAKVDALAEAGKDSVSK